MKMTQKFIFGLLLAAVMTFVLLPATAQAEGGVTEQYNLTPGGTYYFDLSGESLPGTVNDQLPDTSLEWVPFTYVGTINAYSLGAASNNDPLASAKAVASDRSLFVSEYTVTTKVNWGDLNSQSLIFGRSYQSGGVSYLLRSLSAGSNFNNGFDPVTPANNEWDQILAKNAHYIKNFLGVNGFSWGQDTVYHDPNPKFTVNRPLRGFYTAGFWLRNAEDSDMWQLWANCSFRPALEITSDSSTNLKTITFDMGSDGCLGSQSGERNPGSLTSATVVYTGRITLPDFTADDRFTHLSAGWGKLRWSDGTNLYEMGKEYDLPAGTVLRPGYEPVAEQYNLKPGGIYYFDLSGENIPGEVNYTDGGTIPPYGYWPDTTLKWVPFLYAGTINAYSLDASSSGDASASANAAASDRSLFVSTCDGTSNVSWDTLNGKGLIFGRDYQSGGISYSLRSMSMGSSLNDGYPFKWGAQRGLPGNNEWDQLLDKDAIYQFRGWNLANWIGYKNYMGQDTNAKDSSMRAIRRPISYRGFNRDWTYSSTDYVFASHFFRPVLEIKSPAGTELKTITFDLGTGGTLGVNSPSPNPGFDTGPLTSATVVYTGSLTLPEITAANGFNYTGPGTGTLGWYDGTTFYAPGTPVTIATGTTLTAGYGAQSGANDITGFTVTGQTGASTIDTANHTVEFHMPSGTDVTALAPAITVSDNATIIPASGAAQNFSSPASYTVTAQDSIKQVWTVTCVVDPAGDLSGFDVQLAVPGDKTAGVAFDLSITNAKGTDGSALSGDINVTVTDSVYGEVYNAPIVFNIGTSDVPVTLTMTGSHALTVAVNGVTNPETVNVTVVAAVTTGSISGKVLYNDAGGGSGPLEGATVTVNAGGTDYTATTAADGTYTIINVPIGSGYTVTASKTDYNSEAVNNVTVTAGSTTPNVNFLLAAPVNGVIAGVAKDIGNNPISGVTVSLSVSGTVYQAATDISGAYTIPNVPVGSNYAITASKAGYKSETVNNVIVTAGNTSTVDFTLTPASGDVAISIAAIPGVTIPLRGATPVTAITETAQYTGTVTWSPNHAAFAGGTVYTATITLTPKAGYTLSGVGTNFFTVAGAASVSNAVASKLVTAVFPKTEAVATYTVTFDSQGGSPVASITGVASGSTIAEPSAPAWPNHTFLGWYKQTSCVNAWDFGTDTVIGNITLYAKWTYNSGRDSSGDGSGGSGGGSNNSTPATPSYKATVIGTNISKTTLPVSVNMNTGSVTTDLGILAKDIFDSSGTAILTVPSIPGVDTYTFGIPASELSKTGEKGKLTLSTDKGSITIPSNMLAGVSGIIGNKAEIAISKGDKDHLPDDIKTAIGDKPLIQLTLSIDGKQTDWSNHDAPVTVSIPYTPTAAELANPESIVVWYIDGSGNVITTPNGRYDPVTGMVTFNTTHFSNYAVAYSKMSFNDVASSAWYYKAVSFIAARQITSGTGNDNYSPHAKLTRGEFIVLMMRAYGIAPDANLTDNFSDAGNTYYTGHLAAAKRLGISSGIGNNQYAPDKEIARQEMFTLLYNALKVIGQLPGTHGRSVSEADDQPGGDSGKTLSDFTDAERIDAWAKEALTLLVKIGTIGGSNEKLTPQGTTTRAEMAQVLYNLLGK